ncbi:MAG: flagellin [Bradymonadia bacterium]
MIVNHNASSHQAMGQLGRKNQVLKRSFERLASGLRINSAKDDPAGLNIVVRMTTQIRGLNRAVRNASDGVGLAQTAESALQETSDLLQRVRELSIQAANDINSDADRASIQDEITQLIDEIGSIGRRTTFNGLSLLDGTFIDRYLQIGSEFGERFSVGIGDARQDSLGRWAVQTSNVVATQAIAAGDVIINGVTIRATQTVDDGVSTSFATGSAISKAAAINDFTNFTGVRAVVNQTTREGNAVAAGGVLDETNYIVINGEEITGFSVSPSDAGDELINAINSLVERTGVVASRDADGRIQLDASDGRNIEVVTAGGAAGITGLGASDVSLGTLTLDSEEGFQVTGNAETFIGLTNDHRVGRTVTQGLDTISVLTRFGAESALDVVDRVLEEINASRGRLGALQNRLDASIRAMSSTSENISAARSRIQDADFAEESMQLSRSQILTQAANNILAQANSTPQQALSLLQ